MSNLEQVMLDIIVQEHDRRVAAARIAKVITDSLVVLRQRNEATLASVVGIQKLCDKFYAHEGRVAGLLEAIALLDDCVCVDDLRSALAMKARDHHDEMKHYQVMLKVMQ